MSNRRMTSEEMLEAAMARCSEVLSDPDSGFNEFTFHSQKVGNSDWTNRLTVKGVTFDLALLMWPPEEEDGK